jgi:hypothetical protein
LQPWGTRSAPRQVLFWLASARSNVACADAGTDEAQNAIAPSAVPTAAANDVLNMGVSS